MSETWNALIGQSGGPTAAFNATLAGVIRGVWMSGKFEHLYGVRNGIEGILQGTTIDLTELLNTENKLSLLRHTPAAALGSCRKKLPPWEEDASLYEQIFAFFAKKNIRVFFYIGGNDSMDTADKLDKYAKANGIPVQVIGIPKTIDNDLDGTDHTPGFGSAAKFIGTTMTEILSDCAVYTIPAVTIVEIMGRDAGWLTAAAALPRVTGIPGPDYVYLPERPLDPEGFLADIRKALAIHPNVVVAVSEGLRRADGWYVGAGLQSETTDVFGHQYLSGTGKALERIVKERIGCKVRTVELNILQRCASHMASSTDLNESMFIGESAVHAAEEGESGIMVSYVRQKGEYRCNAGRVPLRYVANRVRTVPDEFINAEGNNVTDACVDYLLPLIQGEVRVPYQNGLPAQFVIPWDE